MRLLARGIDKPPIRYTYMTRGKGQGPRGLSPQHADLEGGDVLKQPEKMLLGFNWSARGVI